MKSFPIALLLALACLASTGCYERVVSEKPFPGMAARRVDGPTAPDYRKAQDDFNRQVEARNSKPFNPLGAIGEGIGNAVGGVAKGIGNAVSGGSAAAPAKPASGGTRPITSASDAPASNSKPAPSDDPPPAKGTSPFDAAP